MNCNLDRIAQIQDMPARAVRRVILAGTTAEALRRQIEVTGFAAEVENVITYGTAHPDAEN